MIRKMLNKDIGRVCQISAAAWSKSKTYGDIETDVNVFIAFLKESIMSSKALALVAEVNGVVEGVIIGHVYPWYFSKTSFVAERFFVVTAAGKGMGARLLFRLLAWAKSLRGVNKVMLVASSGMPEHERAEKLYGRIGEKVGSVFHVEV